MVISRLGIPIGAFLLAASVAALRPGSGARAAEKGDTWVEARTPHFTVVSNAGEKQARHVADQFEQIRAAFQKTLNNIRVDPGEQIIILAAKNENTLKALLPEYWAVKGHTHPAGLFVDGAEKNYVAMRLDAEGDNPYHVLYHEYVHLLIRLNFRHLPLWLDEGYAEFFGNTRIGSKELIMGEPSRSHIAQLREARLLPLEILLKVDHRSPYYNEAEKTSVFYAQSWAMVHYLTLDDQMRKEKPLATFGRLIRTDTDDIEAARQAFGDLKQFEKKMESYVRQPSFHYYSLKSPAEIADKDIVTRALSPAESAALRGDFHLHRHRMAEARALLEEALRLDPNLAQAYESMGFLQYHEGMHSEAVKYFARAVQLDSQSYLAHYYHARLLVEGSHGKEALAEAEASLRRATALNPNFAPAYSTLASLYSLREGSLEQALVAARKAVELQPAEARYYLNLGFVLLRMNHMDEARAVAQRLLATAGSSQSRDTAQSLLEQINRQELYLSEQTRFEEQARASRNQDSADVRTEAQINLPTNSRTSPDAAQPPRPAAAEKSRLYSAFGKITEVSCTAPPAMNLTLSIGALVMRLHATNFFKVDYLTTSWKPPANFNPCTHLKGLSAQLSYTLVQGQDYDGEIASVEVRK